MSTVDSHSVREEAERIKEEFSRLTKDKNINPEAKMLLHSMFLLINLLISIFLERTTKKNNKNSSKPSSQTEKDDSSTSNNSANGKGKLESSSTVNNTRTIETVTIAKVIHCDVCGEDLKNACCEKYERRTEIDIIFEKVVNHIDAEVKHCGNCDSLVKGTFPSNMPGPLQYGNGLKAYVVSLIVCQMISLNRVQKMVKAVIGEVLSEATLLKFVLRLYVALELWESTSIESILLCPAINVDETSMRVNKKNQWVHVYSAADITLKLLHPKRGKKAIEDINIIPRYSGTIIHDCWVSYLGYEQCNHGLCGSHIVRELTYIIESNGYHWASNMKNLLLETCKIISKRKKKKLSDTEYSTLQKRYRNIVTQGRTELPIIPPKPNGRRGKIAKSDTHNLLDRLHEYETAVLLFAKVGHVPFTNNRAERDLRMAKVKQKVSGCFRNEIYAHAYCRISSYIQTMANKGYNPLIAIQMALAGKFV